MEKILAYDFDETAPIKDRHLLYQESFRLLEKGEIGGIDLVSSLQEKTYIYRQSQDAIKEKLILLFDYISKRSLVLVMHLFWGKTTIVFTGP